MNRDSIVAGIGIFSLVAAIFTYNHETYGFVTVPLLVLSGMVSMVFCSRIARMINRLNEAKCTPRLPIVWGICVLAAAMVMLLEKA